MKICIYLRKSRAEENMSMEEVLSRHRTTLLAYAKKHNYNVLDIKEEVVSGESIARRPKMLELLHEVEDNKYEAVLVMDIDRLGRGNMREQGLILETFKEFDTKIITPCKIYDLANEFDEEFSEFEAFMARRELKIIKKRLLRGRMKSLEEGNYISAIPPFGYEKKDNSLITNDKQSNVVKLIFDLYVNKNYGDSKIAKYLIENKIPNASNNLNWEKTTIRTLLKNPVYTGKVVWGKKKVKYDNSGKKISRLQDKKNWLIFDGKHEAIIDEITFQKAQSIAKERHNPRKHTSKKLRNPLAGLIICGGCGNTMTIRTCKNKPDTIRCYKNCGKLKSSYIYLIEERVIKIVLEELENIKFEFKRNKKTSNNTELKVLKDTIQSKIKQLNTLNQQKEKLYDLLEQEVYDNDTFLNRMNTLSSKIDNTNEDLEVLKKKVSLLNESKNIEENRIPMINDTIEYIKTYYNSINAEGKNIFLKNIIDRIIYNKNKDADRNDFNLDVYLKI
ncbi:recombinase family protein [Maledivibacter halophilus]|uniref:Site-specific DNA recombinase n=1 Tax=Maledivibacter halophilus TaxID=36842 RepID=A0A1T5IUL6_9FIRM|nr:recombinase family protein [Maledivibacter halophilus]SKC42841.1 Site-specific DNA recombinase [Maledivibacter halophilus]